MSPGITDTLISNGVEDIRGDYNSSHCECCHLERSVPELATDAVALQNPGSENVKSSHQFLARFHRLRWIHPTEHFFPTLTIHCCEFPHEPVARFPFCVFARANAEREQQGHDPNRNVCRGNKKHKKRTSRLGNPNEIVFVFGTSSS